ncbi:MAG: FAD-dependent oxidoreductase [Planctomycetes bacterium]|nr:FAD-dependent oxidoreductase [Planctomycetota bacterium]
MPAPAETSQPLTLVIVGGVAGGATAAARARRMNEHARIILYEKDEHISFANCGLPYYIGGEIADREKLLVAKPELLRQRFNIDVRTRQQVTAIDRPRKVVAVTDHRTGETCEQAYDKLILAPGASPIVPPIPGVDANNVFTLRNVADTDRITAAVVEGKPRRACVVGAGYIGLEMVEQLHARGIEVALVELQEQVLPLMDTEMAQPLAEALDAKGVALHLGDGIAALDADEAGSVRAVRLSSGTTINTDLVILGIGVRPNHQLAKEAGLSLGDDGGIVVNAYAQTDDPDIYAVGDAAQYPYAPTGASMRVPLAGPANRAGRLAGEHAVTGHSEPMPPVMGTAIVRVFDLAAATTGLTIKQADKLGIDAAAVVVIAKHHVGYYPGAKPVTLKLIYAPDTGKVLGAQAVGEEGIDKRIDVIATLMRMNGTVRDLAGVDLCYAPPFGAAKDPVHMAAFAACNDLDGFVSFLQPDADLSRYQVVDVRSAAEVAEAPLPGAEHAHHIPLDELRDRLGELDPQQPTVTSCASGLRSYVAARILTQHGFREVYDLTGAATMRRRYFAGREPAHA